MGVWGYKNFENDTAEDWYLEFLEKKGKDSIFSYINLVLDQEDFIDDEESFIVLAILEGLVGKLELKKTQKLFPIPDDISLPFLLENILKASKKILFFERHSELRELWEESEEFDIWFNYQIQLIYLLEQYYNKFGLLNPLSTDKIINDKWMFYLKNIVNH